MAPAVSKSRSLRTTVPAHVARQLGPEPGSRVKRDIGKVKGEWLATVKRPESCAPRPSLGWAGYALVQKMNQAMP